MMVWQNLTRPKVGRSAGRGQSSAPLTLWSGGRLAVGALFLRKKVHETVDGEKYRCPCCGYFTLDEPNEYDICEVCWWEDDNFQLDNPDYAGGANAISLNQARENFRRIGVSDKRMLDLARAPRPSELTGKEHPPAYG